MEVQESKKYLAGLLLSPHDDGQVDENLGSLRVSDHPLYLLTFAYQVSEIAFSGSVNC